MTAPIPPVGVEHLVRWLREHRGAFTEEALRETLLQAGHPSSDVDAAITELHGATTSRPDRLPPAIPGEANRARDAWLAFLAALGAILGIPAIFVAVGAPGVAVPVAFVALLLSLVGWGVSRDGEHSGVATGLGAALIVAVVTPVIAVIALFGYCLVGGGRVF